MGSRVITPEAIASYPTLVEPEAMNAGEPEKYSIALVFPKGTDLSALKNLALAAAVERFGKEKTKQYLKTPGFLPFREDGEAKGYPEGSVFFNARSQRKPGVVNQIPDADGKPTPIDPGSIYPGAIVKGLISAYGYEVKGNRGVAFGLEGVQFIRDCAPEDRLDGSVSARDAFSADESAVADLSDLEDSVEEEEGWEEDPLADLGT